MEILAEDQLLLYVETVWRQVGQEGASGLTSNHEYRQA